MEATDPRWIAAARVQVRLQAQLHTHPVRNIETDYREMVDLCVAAGFAPLHAQAIVLIAQQACTRGGLDEVAMDELMELPMPQAKRCKHGKLLCFAVLSAWSVCIAGLMVAASRMM